jgi:acyl carrier protein
MNDAIARDVIAALRKIAPDVEPGTVDRAAPLAEQLDLDSMDVQRFLAAVGARYGLDIPDAEVPRLGTLEQLVAYLETRGAR